MSQVSAVQFQTNSRIHMGLAVKDLNASIAFYRILFGQDPSKVRPGYAKFEVTEPPVNLSLSQIAGETGPSNSVIHYGVQVKSTQAVENYGKRIIENGLPMRTEEHVTCCYAVQNKIWISDPDGNQWEVYVVLDDNGMHHASSASSCCTDLATIPGTTQCCQPSLPTAKSAAKEGEASKCCCVTN